jgi:hypothetical protein
MASPIRWTDVTHAWPEIAVATDGGKIPFGAQQVYLTLVNGPSIAVGNFDGEDGTMTRDARILLAAHLATMGLRRGTGLLASQSEGGASQSYIYPWTNPRMLYLTSYGQMFAQMIMGTAARAGTLV